MDHRRERRRGERVSLMRKRHRSITEILDALERHEPISEIERERVRAHSQRQTEALKRELDRLRSQKR